MGGYYRLREVGYSLPAGCHILDRDMVAGLTEATRIVSDAEIKAAEIRAEAEEAYRRECARGYQDGLTQARFAEIERLLEESKALDEALNDVANDLAQVVMSAVRKLTQTFDDFAKAEAVVRGALTQMRREKKAELRVAPAQHTDFRRSIEAIRRDFPEIDLIDVVEDSSLVSPQVVVETSIGRVEGEFGNNLAELEGIFERVFGLPRVHETHQAGDAALQ